MSVRARERAARLLVALAAAIVAIGCSSSRVADSVPAAEPSLSERRSGYDLMSREIRAMQDDDSANPGMLAVLAGEALWRRKAGTSARACADCHGDAATSMHGVAARYPAFDRTRGRPLNLEQRIGACRADRQGAELFAPESRDLLALSAYVARQSRGLPIEIALDARTQPFLDAGRESYFRRQGQLNLSCAQCHDERWGGKLAGSTIPQAHPTGYPLYRLEWQSIGSLSRRLRNCLTGMRAEPYAFGAPELVDIELYLMWRARGMAMEAPAVRP